MKVFIYDKKESKKVATLTDVIWIEENSDTIVFTTSLGGQVSFSKKLFKSTMYQN